MESRHKNDSIVIIPTYNEKENIEAIIRAVTSLEKGFDVLIIDDGSPDGTAQIVKNLMSSEFQDRLHLIERSGKLGLGTAYIRGFQWAIEEKYDYVIEMDADFSHNPADLPRLYAACLTALARGEITTDDYENIESLHQQYNALHGNHTGDALYARAITVKIVDKYTEE